MFDKLIALSPYIVALISVIGVVYTAAKANKNQLTASYFGKMTEAYEKFYECLVQFVYHPSNATRDALTTATYVAALYSSDKGSAGINLVFRKAIERSQTGHLDAEELDAHVGELTHLLRDELARFHKRDR